MCLSPEIIVCCITATSRGDDEVQLQAQKRRVPGQGAAAERDSKREGEGEVYEGVGEYIPTRVLKMYRSEWSVVLMEGYV